MEARVVYWGIGTWFAAYAQVTPLFIFSGIRADAALVVFVLAALRAHSFKEALFFAVCGVFGLSYGLGFIYSLLFFLLALFGVWGIRRILPWQVFPLGITLVLFLTFLTYASSGIYGMLALVPQFAHEAAANSLIFAALYTALPAHYARNGRNQF